ncbi:hypothetical protein E1B28_010625 [Marasmius oreades]|uniref:Uncharacterized protein n=1 Tax=Marasmius oreades TaxID=181124 RepID=A0A9P7USW1_9AGAR|nr:uncharacterized protein E1B28_010625 [Marasmius oreades]KAG7091606.1 hypothetical protein E1B28_010625 [Marasmius oreades]
MTPSVEAKIGKSLRKQLDDMGLQSVKIIGFEHNWIYAGDYPVSLVREIVVLPKKIREADYHG